MNEKFLVKEIIPEEVKDLNPFDINYIAMKDGSIIMVTDKKENLKNDDSFNSKSNKNIIYSSYQIENDQYTKDGDYNIYYSSLNNNTNKQANKQYLIKSNSSQINNNIIVNDEQFNNNSFLSLDDINQNNHIQKVIRRIDNLKDDYAYNNRSSIEKEKAHNKRDNYLIHWKSENNPQNYVITKKYFVFQKTDLNKSKKEKQKYNSKTPMKMKRNFDRQIKNINKNIYTTKSTNLSFKKSKNIVKDRNLINQDNSYMNTSCPICRENKTNYNLIKANAYNNIENNNFEKHKINLSKIDNLGIQNEYIYDQYKNRSILNITDSNNLRSKTPIYTITDPRRKGYSFKNKYKNSLVLKKYLGKDNHRFFERKSLSIPRKSISEYSKMKDLEGNTIHIFKNN